MATMTTSPPKTPQSERVERLAREAECDETGEAFERAFGKIVPPKLPEKRAEQPRKKPGR